jgi:Tfp pilus assembly protein PilN
MINLLPQEIKQSYRYARRNVQLRRWVIICLVALVGLGAITTYGLLKVQQLTTQSSIQVAATQQLFQKEDFAGTQKQVQDISNSFKLVVKVLGQEVLFSQLLKQIAATIPANANLTGLDINQTQGGIDISANTTDYNTATQVQVNLADPANKIFSKADIISINCSNTTSTNPKYPCTINIRALFAANNPFLFINSKAKP